VEAAELPAAPDLEALVLLDVWARDAVDRAVGVAAGEQR